MEILDIEQVAAYLSRDIREVGKLASRGYLPGRKINGTWRFVRAEINHWLESRLSECTPEELAALEAPQGHHDEELLLSNLLNESCVAVPLGAATRGSVLRELVKLAENAWQVYDPEAILQAITHREDMASTALPGGVAIPHAHRALADSVLAEPLLAFGKTSRAIPFGDPRGGLTDLYFLVLSKNDCMHLRVMARLTRLCQLEGFLPRLRDCETPADAYSCLVDGERELLGQQ